MDTGPLREAIRRNVGRPSGGAGLHPPAAVATPTDLGFPAPALPGAGTDTTPQPIPAPLPTAQGRTLCLTNRVPAATRAIIVSPRLGAPFILRRITITGDAAINVATSFRLLIADDNDTTATADPTGSDVFSYEGALIGAEDPGGHAHLTAGPLTLEPWSRYTQQGGYIKFKVHNATGGTLNWAAFIDLDELTQ